MKRLIKKSKLKKKAAETITLYHHTSAQYFMQMMDDGQITPSSYNGNTSGGGQVQYLELASESAGDGKTVNYNLQQLDEEYQSGNSVFHQSVIDMLESAKLEDGWENEEIAIKIRKPSGNHEGVYLTKQRIDSAEYGAAAVNNAKNKNIPDFSIRLEIEVSTDFLDPDLDDGTIDISSDVPYWKQTLDAVDQCVHIGPIDMSSVKSVTVKKQEIQYYDSKFRRLDEFVWWSEEIIDYHSSVSAQEAYSQLQKMYQEFEDYKEV